MSRKIPIYCNDCPGSKNPWKIVEVTSDDAYWHNIRRKGCNAYQRDSYQRDHEYERNNCGCGEDCACGPEYPRECDPKSNACTMISVKNPLSELIIPELTAAAIVGPTVDLTQWTDIITDALNLFDNATGIYTAPEAGDYQVELTVNYETSVTLNVDITLNNVPTIEVYDVDTGLRILGSQLPTTNIVVVVPPVTSTELPIDIPVSTIVSKAQVIINAIIPLRLGQRIRVRALTNGLVYIPAISPFEVIPALPPRIIFDPANVDTTLTIYKARNSPIVTIYCNN